MDKKLLYGVIASCLGYAIVRLDVLLEFAMLVDGLLFEMGLGDFSQTYIYWQLREVMLRLDGIGTFVFPIMLVFYLVRLLLLLLPKGKKGKNAES